MKIAEDVRSLDDKGSVCTECGYYDHEKEIEYDKLDDKCVKCGGPAYNAHFIMDSIV